MKIEKLNENKIKITFNSEYLQSNHLSVHSFMSNSIESQALFSDLLDMAEKEVGFVTENYKIAIEALTQNKDNFTLIVSRFLEKPKKSLKTRLRTTRKLSSFENSTSLYKFDNLEIFFEFSKYIFEKNPDIFVILNEKNSLYFYKESYFLAIDRLYLEKKILFRITSIFSEFSDYISISKNTFQKLKECGKILIEKNAISACITKK